MLAFHVVDEIQQAAEELGHEELYAFALILGQKCNYLGYAIATSTALLNRVTSYFDMGYRYRGSLRLTDVEAIGAWLKWANPAVVDIYGQGGHNNFLNEFAMMQRLNADIQRA